MDDHWQGVASSAEAARADRASQLAQLDQGAVDALDAALERMDEQVKRVEERLAGILRQPASEALLSVPEDDVTALRYRVRRLNGIASSLAEITDRVDL